MKFHTYKVTVAPANPAVTLATVKEHLRIDASDTSDDAYLTTLISVATDFIEKYTKRDLITRTYETKRDCFPGINDVECFGLVSGFEIRRSELQSIASIQYEDTDGNTQTVASTVYYATDSTRWSQIILDDNQVWPTDVARKKQAITITFNAGYGADETSVPDGLKQALLMTIAHLYSNRGDCVDDACASCITGGSNAILNSFRINDIKIC